MVVQPRTQHSNIDPPSSLLSQIRMGKAKFDEDFIEERR